MNVDILKENLITGLSFSGHFVSTKSTLPVLNNLFLKTHPQGLYIQTSNTEQTLEIVVPAKENKAGQAVVPAKLLIEYVQNLKPGKLNLTTLNLDLQLTGINSSATFTGIKPEDFPVVPEFVDSQEISLSVELVQQINKLLTFAASKDTNRPIITGVLCETVGKTKLKLVATDGFRLSILEQKTATPFKDPLKIVVPTLVFTELDRIIKELSPKHLAFKYSPTLQSLQIVSDNITITTRLLFGDYPPYQRILPEKTAHNIILDRIELLDGVRTASLFARHSNNLIRLHFGEELRLESQASTLGSHTTTIAYTGDKPELTLGFNIRYLQDILQHLEDDTITIGINEPLTPVIFKGQRSDFLHVIMPLNLRQT